MVDEEHASDAALMERVKQGDQQAFRTIVESHQSSIFSLCMQYLNDRQDAEEVAQDVFIKLYKAADGYEPRAKLSTFLYRIAVNLSLNRIRDRRRKRLVSLDMFGHKSELLEGESPDQPDRQMEQDENAALIRRAIDALPANQRTAVLLKQYHGMSYEEIASVMKCSVSAVESRLFRAKLNLKKELKSIG
ncbi:RNA polymerase sigma factor [bacterium]|nr:RNA polymerase sigma factor [bacterium]